MPNNSFERYVSCVAAPPTPLKRGVEAVEKVNLVRIRRVGRKCDLSGCSVYDDLMLGRGQETLVNHPVIVLRGFFYGLVRGLEGGPI